MAIGPLASATGSYSVAIGKDSKATKDHSVALGDGSNAQIGAQSSYTGYNLTGTQTSVGEVNVGNRTISGVAAGANDDEAVNVAQLKSVNTRIDSAVMYDSAADKTSVTLNPGGSAATIHNVAAGAADTDAVNLGQMNTAIANADNPFFKAQGDRATEGASATGTHSVASGAAASASGEESSAFGSFSQASGGGAVAVGNQSVAMTDGSVAVGESTTASGDAAIAIGSGAQATGDLSLAAGGAAKASGANSTAIGTFAQATHDNSVALGAGSATTVGAQSGYAAYGLAAPQTSSGEVNIGNRTISGVAAGKNSDDAVNVAQLQGAVSSASNPFFTAQGDRTTEAASATGTHSVASGAAASASGGESSAFGSFSQASGGGAVAVGNQSAAMTDGSVAVGESTTASGDAAIAIGSGAQATGDLSLAAGGAAKASGANSTAIGTFAQATHDNSVALGAGSATTVGAQSGYAAYGLAAPQTSSGEINIGNRTISGVAAGKNNDDAVNVAQLQGAVSSASNPFFTAQGDRTTEAASATGTHSVASGAAASASGEESSAFGSFSQASGGGAVAVGNQSAAMTDGSVAVGETTTASGDAAIAIGSGAQATGDLSLAAGGAAKASGANSTAIGTFAQATHDNSVALGAGSSTPSALKAATPPMASPLRKRRSGEVNIGNRTISGVAAGKNDDDAVNVAQLKGVSDEGRRRSRKPSTAP